MRRWLRSVTSPSKRRKRFFPTASTRLERPPVESRRDPERRAARMRCLDLEPLPDQHLQADERRGGCCRLRASAGQSTPARWSCAEARDTTPRVTKPPPPWLDAIGQIFVGIPDLASRKTSSRRLREILGDPSLEMFWWDWERERYVDVHDREARRIIPAAS